MWTFTPTATERDLRQAYEWHAAMPAFLRSIDAFADVDMFMKDVARDTAFKGMINGTYKALILGEKRSDDVVEGHLLCERRLDRDFLTALIMFAKTESLKTYKQVLIEIPAKSKGLRNLILRAGFNNIGLSKWGSAIRGKSLETQFYVAG